MGAPERDASQPRRRFITRSQVEDAAASRQGLVVGPRDVVTDEAAQRARDLQVTIDRSGGPAPAGEAPPRPGSSRSAPEAPKSIERESGSLRQAVRAAVVAELGSEPRGLDTIIDKVLHDRGR